MIEPSGVAEESAAGHKGPLAGRKASSEDRRCGYVRKDLSRRARAFHHVWRPRRGRAGKHASSASKPTVESTDGASSAASALPTSRGIQPRNAGDGPLSSQ